MTAYRPHLSAKTVDRHLRESLADLRKAEKNAVLWFAEIMNRKLYRELGHSSMHQYAELVLGFKKAKTSQFIRLSRALEELPAVKQSLAENDLPWTKAREITRVATRKTEQAWIQEARNTSRRELEHKVKAVRTLSKQTRGQNKGQATMLMENPVDPELVKEAPVEMRMRMMPIQFARYEATIERLRKMGAKETVEDLILAGMAALAEELSQRTGANGRAGSDESDRSDGGGRFGQAKPGVFTRVNTRTPNQAMIYLCSGCGKATIETSRGPLEISRVSLMTILCDSKVKVKGEKNRATIPPSIRMDVMMRDRHRCQARGCGRNRLLSVHHIIPRECGGDNRPENLVTLCWGCHHVLHQTAERSMQTTVGKERRKAAAGEVIPAPRDGP